MVAGGWPGGWLAVDGRGGQRERRCSGWLSCPVLVSSPRDGVWDGGYDGLSHCWPLFKGASTLRNNTLAQRAQHTTHRTHGHTQTTSMTVRIHTAHRCGLGVTCPRIDDVNLSLSVYPTQTCLNCVVITRLCLRSLGNRCELGRPVLLDLLGVSVVEPWPALLRKRSGSMEKQPVAQ